MQELGVRLLSSLTGRAIKAKAFRKVAEENKPYLENSHRVGNHNIEPALED